LLQIRPDSPLKAFSGTAPQRAKFRPLVSEPNAALEFEEALRRVLAFATPLPSEAIALAGAARRVLAEDVVTPCDLPRFSYSAMDGYAVASSDVAQAALPLELAVSGESRAGVVPPDLVAGSAMRISTGAALPHGADCVVIQEDVERTERGVRFRERPAAGENVRRAGEDLKQGAIALARGTRLTPFHLGLLASLDRTDVLVTRRVRLALLSTGDELRDPGSTPGSFGVPESNSVAVAALAAERAHAIVVASLRAKDEPGEIRERIRALRAAAPDVIVTIGGASVGDHDHVKPALTSEGASLAIYKVKIKPGKPFGFGRLGSSLVLALPGNPVSAQLGFALFGLPLLRALASDARPEPARHRRRLASAIRQKTGRLGFLRATVQGARVTPHDNQASGSSVSLAHADALIVVPADVELLPAGADVEVLLLDEL
jgi:molybdopterin molybdotransferase